MSSPRNLEWMDNVMGWLWADEMEVNWVFCAMKMELKIHRSIGFTFPHTEKRETFSKSTTDSQKCTYDYKHKIDDEIVHKK